MLNSRSCEFLLKLLDFAREISPSNSKCVRRADFPPSFFLPFCLSRGDKQTSLCCIYRFDLHTAGYYKRLFQRTFPKAIPFVCSCLSKLTGLPLVKFSQPILINPVSTSDFIACCCHGISFDQCDAVCLQLSLSYLRLQFLLCQLKTNSIDIFNLGVCSLAQAFSILYPLYHSWHLLFPQACLLVSLEGDIQIRSLILQRDSNKLKFFLCFHPKKVGRWILKLYKKRHRQSWPPNNPHPLDWLYDSPSPLHL